MAERDRALSALLALDAGTNRETWVQLGMAAKSAGLSLEDFTEWSRTGANFGSDKECAEVWRSFKDGGIGAGTLFHYALIQGWKDPAKIRQNPVRAPWKRPAQLPSHAPAETPTAPRIDPTALWNRCLPATPAHPYVIEKRGHPTGLRAVPEDDTTTIAGERVAGWLAVPVQSPDGTLRTLQLIPPPGWGSKKVSLPGHPFGDGAFWVGTAEASRCLYVVEGIGHAWACWAATGNAAVVAFGASRIGTIVESVRHHHPQLPIVLVPDRGQEQEADRIARNHEATIAKLPQDKPRNYDANDYAKDHGTEALAALLEGSTAPASRYRIKSAAEMVDAPPLRWLIKNVLPATGLACLYGASGSGKSFLALDLCSSVARGINWFGYRTGTAPVVYVALEGEAGFGQRVKAWKAHHGHDLPSSLQFVTQPFDLREQADLDALTKAVTVSGGAGGVLVLDTLNRAASGADENTSRDMGEIIDAAKALQTRLGGLVLLVHHSGKDQSRGLRGHSSLIAALDASIEVVKNDGHREWRVSKSKDNADDYGHAFRLQVVEIGRDEDGDAVTSCVVVPEGGRQEIRQSLPPKSGNQRIVLDGLAELVDSEGTASPPVPLATLPRGRRAMPLDRAISGIRTRLPVDPARQTERTKEALTKLQTGGRVGVESGWIWTT